MSVTRRQSLASAGSPHPLPPPLSTPPPLPSSAPLPAPPSIPAAPAGRTPGKASRPPRSPSTDLAPSALIAAITSSRFPHALSLLRAEPKLAAASDSAGYTPLHHALYAGAPYALTEALVTAYPKAVGMADPTDQSLPLHLFAEAADIKSSDVSKVLSLLLRTGSTIGSGVCIAAALDGDDDTALHRAVYKRADAAVVEQLCAAYAGATLVRNKDGDCPLDVALRRDAKVDVVAGLVATMVVAFQAGAGAEMELVLDQGKLGAWAAKRREAERAKAIVRVLEWVKAVDAAVKEVAGAKEAEQRGAELKALRTEQEHSREALEFVRAEFPDVFKEMGLSADEWDGEQGAGKMREALARVHPLLRRYNRK